MRRLHWRRVRSACSLVSSACYRCVLCVLVCISTATAACISSANPAVLVCSFCLPGALDFQHLHSDGAAAQSGRYGDVKLGTRADGSTFYHDDPEAEEAGGCSYRTCNFRDLDVSHVGVTVNFPMGATPSLAPTLFG